MKNLKKLSLGFYLILGVLIILYIFLYFDEKGIDLFLIIITPLITLFTGIIIYKSLQEAQKSNKYRLSVELRDDLMNEIDKHIDTKRNFSLINVVFRDGKVEDSINQDCPVGKIKESNIDNWYFNIMSMLELLQNMEGIEDSKFQKNGEITMEQYGEIPNAYLFDKVNALLRGVRDYIQYLQDHLYSLINADYDDIIDLHRSFIIRKILKEDSHYTRFFLQIEKYFDYKDGTLRGTTSCSQTNIETYELVLGPNDKGKNVFKARKRLLVDWTIFSDLYFKHNKIIELSKSQKNNILNH